MKIRIFGEVNPFEDEQYQTFFHLTNKLDINLVLNLEELPPNDDWVLEYDEFIGNISTIYKNVQKQKRKTIKEKFPEDYKLLDIELDTIEIRTCVEEYARWEYVGFTDDMPGYEGDVAYILNIFTDSLGNVLSVEEFFE